MHKLTTIISPTRQRVEASLKRRRRRERLFRTAGFLATAVGIVFLVIFLAALLRQGASAFSQTHIRLDVSLDPDVLAPDPEVGLASADFDAAIRDSLRTLFPGVEGRENQRQLRRLASIGAASAVRDRLDQDPGLLGSSLSLWVPAAANIDMLVKGQIDPDIDPALRPVSDLQIAWVGELTQSGRLERRFNAALLLNGDSREPELAGVRSAMTGSFLMLSVTLLLAFPIGVATAIYLEDFAPSNRLTDLIEVNINNLAAVPSIIFGLLGLSVFISWAGMPRSAAVVGGLVLSLMTLPVIIIASRAAIKSVPAYVREAALALGASRMQIVAHHVMPAALPGILTGTILGMSRALGESAPLLMIGMVAFIVDVPQGFFDPTTALPVQIYLWADSPERAFAERTSAAIIVLLGFLFLMNLAAVLLRSRMERRG